MPFFSFALPTFPLNPFYYFLNARLACLCNISIWRIFFSLISSWYYFVSVLIWTFVSEKEKSSWKGEEKKHSLRLRWWWDLRKLKIKKKKVPCCSSGVHCWWSNGKFVKISVTLRTTKIIANFWYHTKLIQSSSKPKLPSPLDSNSISQIFLANCFLFVSLIFYLRESGKVTSGEC